MTEDEIKKAIEKGKLPIKTVDVIVMISYLILVLVGIYEFKRLVSLQNNIFLFLFTICLILLAFEFWQIFAIKKLIAYSSNLTTDKKISVIDKLVQLRGIYSVTRKNHYTQYEEKAISRYLISHYQIAILTSEDSYYINVVNNGGRLFWFSKDKANEIIERIKKVESEP